MITRMGTAKITILMDNSAQHGLLDEHGFSAWIETAGRRILFDTGQGPAFADNADKVGIDLRTADTIILSHGHYDHTGGLSLASAKAPAAAIYAHPALTGPRYTIRDGAAKTIAMSEDARAALKVHPGGVWWATSAIQVRDGVGVTGPIPRLTDYEDTGGPFFIDPDGMQPDPLTDDLALWMRSDRGLVVVVGCSHAGLVNTLRHALKMSGERRLHAVLGGFHLVAASEVRLARTMIELQELGLDLIVPCHCTGDTGVQRLKDTFGNGVIPGCAGAVFQFGLVERLDQGPTKDV